MTADQHAAGLAERLADITANLEAYIETRAAQIAGPRIAEVEQSAAQELTETQELHARQRQRWTDLEAELRRQLDAQTRRAVRLGDALLDICEYAERHADPDSGHVRAVAVMGRRAVGYRRRSGSERAEVWS